MSGPGFLSWLPLSFSGPGKADSEAPVIQEGCQGVESVFSLRMADIKSTGLLVPTMICSRQFTVKRV